MHTYNNSQEPLRGYSDGQLWLYQLMQRMYQNSGSDIAIPVNEIAGLMEYGAIACRSSDRAFWQEGVRAAGSLPRGWYEREESAERHFTQLGLVAMQVDVELHVATNN